MPKLATKENQENFIKFLGTSGARFMMIRQLRASGGIWVSCKGSQVLIDPGPGSVVRCALSKPRLDPTGLDGIILTHRHLDHSGDINVMIEAMTEGGYKKRGLVYVPEDTISKDTVILRHLMHFSEKIEILKPLKNYKIGNFEFMTSMRHIHPVETYGIKFNSGRTSISLLSDTKYFAGLKKFYKTDILIISVVFFKERTEVEHLCLADAEELIDAIRPRKAILTHFGMTMLNARPDIQARELSGRLGIEVLAAYDGMTLPLE